jgi:hypothetical protein
MIERFATACPIGAATTGAARDEANAYRSGGLTRAASKLVVTSIRGRRSDSGYAQNEQRHLNIIETRDFPRRRMK